MRSFFFWLAQEANILTWIVTVTLDLLWNLLEGMSIFSGIGILCYPFVMGGIFVLCATCVAFIQHFFSGDEWGPAINKGAVFGVIAALPFSVTSLIVGSISLLVRGSMSRDYTAQFGSLGLNYRELEKTIKRAANKRGRLNGGWGEMTMDTAIDTLERCGDISAWEARELHALRKARNAAHHEETPADLHRWVDQSEQLLQKYQGRFGRV